MSWYLGEFWTPGPYLTGNDWGPESLLQHTVNWIISCHGMIDAEKIYNLLIYVDGINSSLCLILKMKYPYPQIRCAPLSNSGIWPLCNPAISWQFHWVTVQEVDMYCHAWLCVYCTLRFWTLWGGEAWEDYSDYFEKTWPINTSKLNWVQFAYMHQSYGLYKEVNIPVESADCICSVPQELILNLDIVKSCLPITYFSIVRSFWYFAQSMAIWLILCRNFQNGLPETYFSIVKSFWNFAHSMAVSLSYSVQNFIMIS